MLDLIFISGSFVAFFLGYLLYLTSLVEKEDRILKIKRNQKLHDIRETKARLKKKGKKK